eukprot:1616909-Amphidinium_carterae.1
MVAEDPKQAMRELSALHHGLFGNVASAALDQPTCTVNSVMSSSALLAHRRFTSVASWHSIGCGFTSVAAQILAAGVPLLQA